MMLMYLLVFIKLLFKIMLSNCNGMVNMNCILEKFIYFGWLIYF